MDKLTVYITVQFFSVDGSIRTPQSFLTVEFGRERIHDMMEAGGRGGGWCWVGGGGGGGNHEASKFTA